MNNQFSLPTAGVPLWKLKPTPEKTDPFRKGPVPFYRGSAELFSAGTLLAI
jgi:hypothetical protein